MESSERRVGGSRWPVPLHGKHGCVFSRFACAGEAETLVIPASQSPDHPRSSTNFGTHRAVDLGLVEDRNPNADADADEPHRDGDDLERSSTEKRHMHWGLSIC